MSRKKNELESLNSYFLVFEMIDRKKGCGNMRTGGVYRNLVIQRSLMEFAEWNLVRVWKIYRTFFYPLEKRSLRLLIAGKCYYLSTLCKTLSDKTMQ